jgi:hypothetical protein
MLGNDPDRFSFKKISKNPERYYIIHYSCQSLYDDNEGLSPRIASIVVMHGGLNSEVHHLTDYQVINGPNLQSPQR